MGGNMPENRPIDLKLLSNDEVLQVNQRGQNPKQLYLKDGDSMVWYAIIPGSKDIYVGLFNLSETANTVKVDLSSLGLKGRITVRDLWKKQNVGSYQNDYQQTINRHGAVLLRLSPR